jgi:hypothetical protein
LILQKQKNNIYRLIVKLSKSIYLIVFNVAIKQFAGISFLSQTGTGDYAGTYTGSGLESTSKLEITMLSDGVTKYMNFVSGSNGVLYYNYKVIDPNKTEATASMIINNYQQGSSNRKTGIVYGSVNIKVNHPVVFSFNSGYIPESETSTASGIFKAYIDAD